MGNVDIKKVIDGSKMNSFHFKLLFVFILLAMFDGYDMFYLGNIIPSLIREWQITPETAGMITSSGLFGMVIGALFLGMMADKLGRRQTIVAATVLFSLFTLIASFSMNAIFFSVCRFIAGLGLGGILPVLNASLGEVLPKDKRISVVTLVNIGVPIGSVLTSLVAMFIIPQLGWRAMLWVGALPILFVPLILKVVPNSPEYSYRQGRFEDLAQLLNRITNQTTYNAQTYTYIFRKDEKGEQKNKLFDLFVNHRALTTLIFWTASFMNLVALYGLSTWLPQMMVNAGYSLTSSISFLLILNIGSIAGAIVGGGLADWFRVKYVIVLYFATCFAVLMFLGFKPVALITYTLLFIAGATTSGTQMLINSYIASFYPSHIKSTGTGWGIGIGRIGGICGPLIGGLILGLGTLPYIYNFVVFAIPCLIAAIVILFVQEKYSATR